MLETPPIFIVGMPRSGTTLLGVLLNSHSQVGIAMETHYYPQFYRKGERRGCLADRRAFEKYVRYFLESSDLDTLRLSSEERVYLFDRIMCAEERSHRLVLGTVLSYYAERQGKTIYGEKTPVHMHYVDTIKTSFPDARVILVIRDPRDVVLSLRKVAWERGNMLEHLAQWQQSVHYIERYTRAYGDRFTMVKYEDLITAPEATTRRLCSFLDLPFEPDMLAYHQRTNIQVDVEAEPWKVKNLQPIDPKNQMKWKSRMTPWECAVVEGQVGREITRLEYPLTANVLDTKTRLRLGYLYLENLALLSRHWMKRAWLRLTSSY